MSGPVDAHPHPAGSELAGADRHGAPPRGTRAAGRDRYLDLLRAIALVRVVAYHAFGGAFFSLVFPAMGVMFALAGSLMARSLDRPALGVLRSRTRRLLLPVWVYSATVLGLLLWQSWSPADEGGSWWQLLLWFVPVADPPYPESIGTGIVDPGWALQAGEILWYVRAYFWFMLLSPLMLKAFRAAPWPALAAPLVLLGVLTLDLVTVPDWAYSPLTDVATYGSCWMLGFAHHTGQLRRVPRGAVLAAGPVVMGMGLWWAAAHAAETGWDLNDVPVAQALWSLGFCAMLLRVSPAWQSLPGPLRFLDRFVTLVNNRALTVYLWHNLLLVATVAVVDGLYEVDALSTAVPWVLESTWTQFAMVWVMLGVLFVAVGWVEDVAARRRPRLWPDGSRGTAPSSTGAPATAPGGWSWMYPRSLRPPRVHPRKGPHR